MSSYGMKEELHNMHYLEVLIDIIQTRSTVNIAGGLFSPLYINSTYHGFAATLFLKI